MACLHTAAMAGSGKLTSANVCLFVCFTRLGGGSASCIIAADTTFCAALKGEHIDEIIKLES